MTCGGPSAPAPLTDAHDLAAFDCGVASLNEWLQNRALKNERSGASRTYVVCSDGRVGARGRDAAQEIESLFREVLPQAVRGKRSRPAAVKKSLQQ